MAYKNSGVKSLVTWLESVHVYMGCEDVSEIERVYMSYTA